jgi:hypothetical protein
MTRSKKRSSTKGPPDPVFFIDRDLSGKAFVSILREAAVTVEVHSDHFRHDAPDEDWLPAVGRQNWVALTHDKRISYSSLQTDLLMRAAVRTFILIGKATHEELAENFVRSIPKVRRFLQRQPGPFIAKVHRNVGGVEMWLSKEQWARRRGKR